MNYPYEKLDVYTLPNLFDRSIKLYANKSSLGFVTQEPMTYATLNKRVQEMIALLKERNISKGDKVALLSENMPNWAIAYFSVTYIGAVIVPILPDFHATDVHNILKHSEAKAIFVSHKYEQTIKEYENSHVEFTINLDTLEVIKELDNPSYITQITEKIKENIPLEELSNMSTLDENSFISNLKQKIKNITKLDAFNIAEEFNNTTHLSQITLNLKATLSQDGNRPKENDLAAIIYTSGTTGHSKGVMLSHKNLVTNAMSSFCVLSIRSDDVLLSILPLAHTFECTVGLIVPILHGSSVYYIKKAPTPTVLLKAFSVVKPTMMLSVPLVIEKIYKSKILVQINASFITKYLYTIPFARKILNKIVGNKLKETFGGRLRFYGIGGAALATYVEEFLYEANFPYVVGYGLTETAPLIAGTPLDMPNKLKSTGPVMYGVEVKLKDVNPQTGEGEICVKSPSVMMGYYKDKEKTDEVFEDGWFLTGDLGYIDDDGYIFISGRSKNVIVGSGGENIYPEQIESIINQHEIVLDSLVLEKEGRLVARIHLDEEKLQQKLEEEKEKLLEELRIEINSKVSSFSRIVKFIEQREPFIKTPTKKIKRYLYAE